MDFEDKVLQLIPCNIGNAWVRQHDADGNIFYERIAAFALTVDKFGNQRVMTLTLSGDGRLYEPDGYTLVYSDTMPEEGKNNED